jgi:hypothetical protein
MCVNTANHPSQAPGDSGAYGQGANVDHLKLWVVTAVANPLRWASRTRLAEDAVLRWLDEPNVHIVLVECAYGERPFELKWLAGDRVKFVGVRAATPAWSKENLLNIGVTAVPAGERYIATFDADIRYREAGWASEIIHTLQLFPVIQPWTHCFDAGPRNEFMQMHTSFASLHHSGYPVAPGGAKFWRADGGPHEYAHSGFAWAWTREALDVVGGLFEMGGMGSGDYHMALGLVGEAHKSVPGKTSDEYLRSVLTWQARALAGLNKKIGAMPHTIEHMFHGSKETRSYIGRWDMFTKHRFDPARDLKRNSYGVIEWAGNNPELEREWMNYLRARNEDANTR